MAQLTVVKLGEWQNHFPDGVSVSHYRRICNAIVKYGSILIKIIPGDHDSLEKALVKLEGRKQCM